MDTLHGARGEMADAMGARRWAALLDDVAEALERMDERGWLVGGCLRDALLGVAVHDVDLAVTCEPIDLARAVKRGRTALTIAALNRDTVRLGLRGEDGEPPLQLDLAPLHGGSIEADLALRDFRVNALALPLDARREFFALLEAGGLSSKDVLPEPDNLLDPLGGYTDLQQCVLATTTSKALTNDPGRIIRAARLVASHGFILSHGLVIEAQLAAHRLVMLPGDRVRDEMSALLRTVRAAEGVRALAEIGALRMLLPQLATRPLTTHALASVRAVGGLQDGGEAFPGMEALESLEPLRAWYAAVLPDGQPRIVALRWGLLGHAAVFHAELEDGSTDDESRTRRIVERLPLAGAERAIVAQVIHAGRWQAVLAEHIPDDMELRHFFAAAGDAAVDVIVAAAACSAALVVAPVEGQRFAAAVGERARSVLDVYFTDRERLVPPRLLGGGDLMRELGMAPGPEIGDVLRGVRQAQLDGRVRTREEALEWARRHAHL